MPSVTAPQEAVTNALRRAAAYEFLAHAFAYPDDERLDALREASSHTMTTDPAMPILRLATIAGEVRREALEPVFVSLITFSSSPDCPAFESAYVGGDAQRQTQRMADIAGFYRAFGVDAAEGGYRPDDLSVELGFMSYLCHKEAYAVEHLGAPRAGQARRAQRLFLQEHLGTWAAVFGRKFASQAPVGHFYSSVGDTLAWWIEEECRAAGANPVQLSPDAAQSWPVPASHGPEFAGESSFIPMEQLDVR